MASTVLVTGAAGAIGSATVRALRAEGRRVVGLDKQPAPADAVEWIEHDLLDTPATERILAESPLLEGLQHVVAVAGGPTDEEVGQLDPAEVPVEVFAASVRLNLVAQYAIVRAGAQRIEAETPHGDRSITLFSSIKPCAAPACPATRPRRRACSGSWWPSRCHLGAAGCGSTPSHRDRDHRAVPESYAEAGEELSAAARGEREPGEPARRTSRARSSPCSAWSR